MISPADVRRTLDDVLATMTDAQRWALAMLERAAAGPMRQTPEAGERWLTRAIEDEAARLSARARRQANERPRDEPALTEIDAAPEVAGRDP